MNPVCGNCGKKGHFYKKCLAPITSMGIVCYDIDKYNKIKYIMICRKHSLAFVEFIRGKYDMNEPEYIMKLLERMTLSEIMEISVGDYDRLHTNLWKKNNENYYHYNEYIKAKAKYDVIKNGIKNDKLNYSLSTLLNKIETEWTEPEWEFPKGRRNNNETDLQCAIREFNEETNLKEDDYKILNIEPISETYTSVNKVKYKNIYYIAKLINKKCKLHVAEDNKFQNIEISKIGIYSYENALDKIRNYQTDKLNVLHKINKYLLNLLSFSNSTTKKSTTKKPCKIK